MSQVMTAFVRSSETSLRVLCTHVELPHPDHHVMAGPQERSMHPLDRAWLSLDGLSVGEQHWLKARERLPIGPGT